MTSFLKRTASERGVSLLETLLTVGIMAIVGGMATAKMSNARRTMQGDGAMRVVMAEINMARDMAMAQRRNMEVQFVGGNWVRIVRHEAPGIVTTVLHSAALESNATFALTPNVPDTPDGFGNASSVCFGTACNAQGVMFGTEGTLIDANGTPINGTVFLSIASQASSTRAVAVLGATGRIRGYKWVPPNTATGFIGGWNRV